MKVPQLCASILALVALACGLWSFSSPTPGPAAHSVDPLPRLQGVRAEYAALAGNLPVTNTTCYLVNRSFTSPITIQVVSVLGEGGRTDLLGTHPTLQGTTIAPLGELRIPIDDSIPGVLPQTSEQSNGVRNVLVRWSGPKEALRMTAGIVRYPTGQVDVRDRILEQAYEVIP